MLKNKVIIYLGVRRTPSPRQSISVKFSSKRFKTPFQYRLSYLFHEGEIVVQIVNRSEAEIGQFSGAVEVSEVASGVVLAGVAGAGWIDGGFVGGVGRFLDIDLAKCGEECAVAGVAGGHDAIEHIDTPCDVFDEILGGANTHEVAGFVGGHEGNRPLHRIVHRLIGLADAQSANCKAVKVQCGELFGRLLAKGGVGAALDDGENVLLGADATLLIGAVVGDRLLSPASGAGDALGDALFGGG